MINEYYDIINMTNAEAAIVINDMLETAKIGRGNGKSIQQLRAHWALGIAVRELNKVDKEKIQMSRHCYECSEDQNCERQKNGVVSCGDGNKKTVDRQVLDLNTKVIGLIPVLDSICTRYKELNCNDTVLELNHIIGYLEDLEYIFKREDVKNESTI